ncbi:unnamed protein product [Soboliphyme baturini]|uniref:Ionotropic glutamate receptor C-terminal domain-containing protein n=1 Tax=Soboliphyme baturini TaxID=241478 RepID=A0A183IAW2_9BILA|nr:unnamed protein product [Soboliphyme baturini]
MWKALSLNTSLSPLERAQLAVWDYPVNDKYTNIWRYMLESGLPDTYEEAVKRVLKSKSSTEGFALIDASEGKKRSSIWAYRVTRFSAMSDDHCAEFCWYSIAHRLCPDITDNENMFPAFLIIQLKSTREILQLLNQRELETLKENWWNKNPNKKNCLKPDSESDGISIINIGGVFIVILIGIGLSMTTLIFEYFYNRQWQIKCFPSKQDQNTKVSNMYPTGNGCNVVKY